ALILFHRQDGKQGCFPPATAKDGRFAGNPALPKERIKALVWHDERRARGGVTRTLPNLLSYSP
ncbi:hypothetical protein, partial [Desulfosporosinus fructosivorans]